MADNLPPRTSAPAVDAPRDWPAEATALVVRTVDQVKSKTTRPAMLAARGVVYGLIAGLVGITIAIVLFIGLFRAVDIVVNEIVEDTVRPRDPALLEWLAGGDLSLRIFPIPAKSSRKVLLAYNQALNESGGRVRYIYPLSVGGDRATKVDELSIHVAASDTRARLGDIETPRYPTTVTVAERNLEARFGAKNFTPTEDFVLERRGDVVVVSCCSGHGFKFTPEIGRRAAMLAAGQD